MWNSYTVVAYRKLCKLLGGPPDIVINKPGGGCIWKTTTSNSCIKQFCLTDAKSETSMHMQVMIKLFAGYGNVHITSKGYDQKVSYIISNVGGVSYDPYAQCLYVYGTLQTDAIDETIIDMFTRAAKCVQLTEAFTDASYTNPHKILDNYYRKHIH